MAFSLKSLETLPVELLYEIHFFALSEHLPLTCKHLYAVYRHAPHSVHATYLFGRHQQLDAAKPYHPTLLSHILCYPLATQPVISAILSHPLITSHQSLLSTPPDLPRRLFRSLTQKKPGDLPLKEGHDPLPFLKFLYSHPKIPKPNTNAHDGYALTKAVLSDFVPLIAFLLEHGADPRLKRAIAVNVAIQMQDLGLVKMLVERGHTSSTDTPSSVPRSSSPGRRAGCDEGVNAGLMDGSQEKGDEEKVASGVKKRKVEDRVKVTPALLHTAVKHRATHIANWMMHEKGCMPEMSTLSLTLRRLEQEL